MSSREQRQLQAIHIDTNRKPEPRTTKLATFYRPNVHQHKSAPRSSVSSLLAVCAADCQFAKAPLDILGVWCNRSLLCTAAQSLHTILSHLSSRSQSVVRSLHNTHYFTWPSCALRFRVDPIVCVCVTMSSLCLLPVRQLDPSR